MTRRPIATVRVIRMPHVADGCVRVEIECSESITSLTSIPGDRLDMPLPQIITAATLEHEARCGECDTSAAHDRGDQHVRGHVERLHGAVQAEMTRRYSSAHRN